MRRVTRNLIVAIVLVVLALLALGALPSYLGSGEPYYLTVEETSAEGTAIDANNVSERRFPYLADALRSTDGRSEPYQQGPYGVKEHFTHTPFDEVNALQRRVPEAVTDDERVLVRYEGQHYYVNVVRGPQ